MAALDSEGRFPLPRKLIITETTDEARPQYTAVYTWNLAPSFNEAAFVFEPPPGAQRVSLADAPSEHGQNAARAYVAVAGGHRVDNDPCHGEISPVIDE